MKEQKTAGFPAKKDKAAAMLASGLTVRAVASKIGVNERTVHTWRDDPEFLKLVGRYQAQMIARALGRLSGKATRAVLTLAKCLDSEDGDGVRVRAALGILDQLVRIRDATEIETRLTELEKRMPKHVKH
jgi:hypothetical protein